MTTDSLLVEYRPPGPVTAAFLADDSFVRGLRGPIGSGKSTACVVDLLRRITAQRPSPDGVRRSRWAVVRNTYPELKTTTIATWHQIVSPQLGQWVSQGPPTHRLRGDDLDAEVLFLALDSPEDVKKLLSLELTGAWINEAREVPRAVLDTLTGRVGRYPAKMAGGCSWSGVLMDTNPPDSDHWWFRLAEDERPDGYRFFAQPSGLSPDAENVANLPDGYYQRLIPGKPKEWIDVYIHGQYGFVQDGRPVHPEYRDHLHCKPFDLNPARPIHIGIDFGLTPAAVILQRTTMGAWRCRYELTTEHMGAQRFGLLLKQFLAEKCPGYEIAAITGDPAGQQEAQTDERTPFQILASVGVDARPAPTNDFQIRRETLDQALMRTVDGDPGFLIHPDCAVTRRGLAGRYGYKRIQMAGDRFADKPEKNRYSHPVEAVHYALLGGGEQKVLLGGRTRRRPEIAPDYYEFSR